jgi:acetylglutamate/LysW-gamma-L-alpha-aminoadipate kinase
MHNRTPINVLKIGGGAGIDVAPVMQNLARRMRRGERWIVVHGASDATNTMAQAMGYEVQMLTSPGGHTSRYTNAEMIEIYSAAAASVNQQITADLGSCGVQAAGLAGPNVIAAERKTAIRAIRNGRMVVVRDDHSGRITGVDADLIWALLDAGTVPVIAPVALGTEGERLNVDGDLVAATIARTLGAENLIILSNVPGLLRDVCDPGSLVRRFSLAEMGAYESLAQGRMKKKLIAASEAGAERVILADARADAPLDAALAGEGTHIVRDRAAVLA